jgi:hypothetical protein
VSESEPEPEEEAAEEANDDAPDAGNAPAGEEEKPSVSEEQTADLDGLDLDGDELDPATDDDAEGTDGDAEDADADDNDSPAPSDGFDPDAGEWGEMYVSVCKQATNSIIEKHGEDDYTVDESHFTAIELDKHFNEVMKKYGSGSEMEPERALVVGTTVAIAGPVALHTDLLSDLAGEFEL